MLAWLLVLDGKFDQVRVEADEDIECRKFGKGSKPDAADNSCLRHDLCQVKTAENRDQLWSPAQLTRQKKAGKPETSILGKLFTSKSVPDSARFRLVLDHPVSAILGPLLVATPGSDLTRGASLLPISEDADSGANRALATARLTEQLAGLVPAGGRNLQWCLERLDIEVCYTGGIEVFLSMLSSHVQRVAWRMHIEMLPEEADIAARVLVDATNEESNAKTPRWLGRNDIEAVFKAAAERGQADIGESQGSGRKRLTEKLEPVFKSDTVRIAAAVRLRIEYGRQKRRAVGAKLAAMEELSAEVGFMCEQIQTRRLMGEIPEGLPAFHHTLTELGQLFEAKFSGRDLTKDDAVGALHDVTARCRNRYVT